MAIRQVLQDRLPLRPDIQAGAGDAMNRAADGRAGAEGFDLCDFHFFLGLNMDLLYHIRGVLTHSVGKFGMPGADKRVADIKGNVIWSLHTLLGI